MDPEEPSPRTALSEDRTTTTFSEQEGAPTTAPAQQQGRAEEFLVQQERTATGKSEAGPVEDEEDPHPVSRGRVTLNLSPRREKKGEEGSAVSEGDEERVQEQDVDESGEKDDGDAHQKKREAW